MRNSYELTRILFLRYIGFIYAVAFLVAITQNRGLIGDLGLTPAKNFMERIYSNAGSDRWRCATTVPTILWYIVDIGDGADTYYRISVDTALNIMGLLGFLLSCAVTVLGAANVPMMATMWLLYTSIVNVGQTWYSFGWESQLLETGFLAIWLCPWVKILPRLSPARACPPSRTVIAWGYRWLLFRIMIGAGMIKIRGDECWRDLTCMDYHYQTQPVPNPFSFFFHEAPHAWHRFETMGNHLVELLFPWLLLLGRDARFWGGVIQIIFQAVLICSGNLSFLNWLTIAPAIWCFDDAALLWCFHSTDIRTRHEANLMNGVGCAREDTEDGIGAPPRDQPLKVSGESGAGDDNCKIRSANVKDSGDTFSSKEKAATLRDLPRRTFALLLFALLAKGSVPVVANLLSSRQAMNTSFDVLRIVNTYGAFGTITRKRTEVVLQGTNATTLNGSEEWRDFEFKCKPGAVDRRPCLISPFHFRLDWLMWFAAFQSYQQAPWIVHITARFLKGKGKDGEFAESYDAVRGLIASDPFIDRGEPPPHYIRAQHFQYRFADASKGEVGWWHRDEIGNYLPPLNLGNPSLHQFLRDHGW